MPTEQRRHMPPFHLLPGDSESSIFADELRLRTERQVGLLKQGCFPEDVDRLSSNLGSKFITSSPLEKLKPIGAKVEDQSESMQPYKLMDRKTAFGLEDKFLGLERHANLPPSPLRTHQDLMHRKDSFSNPLALHPDGRRINLNGTHYESGLFSCSLPDIFDKKMRLTPKNGLVGEHIEKVDLNHVDDEPFELSKEIEAQIIGNLLPNDDDLLSGVLDDVGYTAGANNRDDVDDDIFYTGGGMELEADETKKLSEVNGGTNNGQVRLNGQLISEPTSRILFVGNIDSSIEDSELKLIFEQYGDIHTLNTSCKHRGFVVISYYDVRSAENAMKALQTKPLRCRTLDIHYSIPKGYPLEEDINQGTLVVFILDPSVSNDELNKIFGIYGEIKEIRNTSYKGHCKSVEFYDVRAAEAARYALKRSEIAGNKIKLEPSCQAGTNRLRELEQEQFRVCNLGSPNTPSSTFFGSQRNPCALAERSHSLGMLNRQTNGQMNYGFQDIGAFHPHSLPEYSNGASNGITYSLSTITPIVGKSNSRTAEATESRHIYNGGSGNFSNHSSGHTEAIGLSRTGSCLHHGHQLRRSNSNNFHCQSSSPILLPRTGPFISNMPSRSSTQVHGISRALPGMLENIIPVNHHVGSAPAVNPSIWDRRHGYAGEMVEAPGFHPGSAGSMGFPGSPHLRQLESNSMFPHTGGAFVDQDTSPAHMGVPSQQRGHGHMFHGRRHMASVPSSFDSPGERMRSRRNESSANQSDNKRLYELDIERIIRGEDSRTTLMIKNIPNKYTSKMLLAVIDESHRGTYDFIYLPIDFKNKCNVGYAFINMISPENIVSFYKTFNGKRWEKFNSEKVASLAYARIQGKSALIAHFQNSSLMNEDKRCRPILFHSDGPNAGDQNAQAMEPFPVGTNIRSRPGRFRTSSCEGNHQNVARGYITKETDPIAAS
ncbi:hypothetical protein ACP70R_011727 [Stipagrostis hirtigluma subsp. patula]